MWRLVLRNLLRNKRRTITDLRMRTGTLLFCMAQALLIGLAASGWWDGPLIARLVLILQKRSAQPAELFSRLR